jgi:hypothetical protein
MRSSRITRAWIALSVGVATGLTPTVAAVGQETDVRLRLQAQTPWTTMEEPFLHLELRAANLSDRSIEDMSVGLAMGPAVRTRNEYETTLTSGLPFVVFAQAPSPVPGTLDPGEERMFRLDVDVATAVSSTESLVYLAEATLFAEGRPLATLTTPVVHIVREPEVPVLFTWWTTLAAGTVVDPAGRLIEEDFEASIADGGSLAEAVRALTDLAERDSATSIAVVLEPLLLEQLREMAGGYERVDGSTVEPGTGGPADAARLLEQLREAARNPAIVPVVLPYAAPKLPVMVRSGLVGDLIRQYELGDELVLEVLGRGGAGPVAAAPADSLDDASLSFLDRRGATVVLADPEAVARPDQPNFFAPPPTAAVPLVGGRAMSLVLPDPGTQALLERPELRADPVRLAQVVLGELAVIWREQPVPIPPTVRGLALALPRDLPPAAWAPLVRRLSRAPFLLGTPAPTLVSSVNPSGPPAALASPSQASFSQGYVEELRTARREVEALQHMAPGGSDTTARLLRGIAVAEAGRSVGRESVGRAWLASVLGTTGKEFERVAPLPDQVFTLTSATGTILVRLGDPGPESRRVVVELQSSWFRFPGGATRATTLEGATQPIPFDVQATGTGRRTIRVRVHAGSSAGLVIAERDIVVGSTAANRVALVIAGAAGLGLVALWARRLLRRTRA